MQFHLFKSISFEVISIVERRPHRIDQKIFLCKGIDSFQDLMVLDAILRHSRKFFEISGIMNGFIKEKFVIKGFI